MVPHPTTRRRRLPGRWLAAACCAIAPAVHAETLLLPPVSVTARVDAVPAFDLPASIDVIDVGRDSARAQASLSEVLGGVPGVLARDRQNLAQDTQLSIRGFGARASFGVRGVRLYADGIPASMPDGQGQLSHFALAAADRVEVMRGPFSALYGNSSGGVVQLWSADGYGDPELVLRATGASHGNRSGSARLLGGLGDDSGFGYHLAVARLDDEGFREHSAARRDSLNLKLRYELDDGGRIELVGNRLDAPDAQDPLGLTAAQWRADPRQAAPQALLYDTRKSVRQDQLGLAWTQPLGAATTLRATGYGGRREVEQFLAVPVAAQASPTSAGGVVDLDGDYGGLDTRLTWTGLDGRFEFTAGTSLENQRQQRRGCENFEDGRLGVRGALRRDQDDRVRTFDQYAQAWWRLAPRWSLQAGARHSTVRFVSTDHYVTASNPDDSGAAEYTQTTPVAGLVFAPKEDLRVYLSAGRGFETPTFNELAYRADGTGGLAFDLRPAVSRNLELGLKWRDGDQRTLQLALFRADTRDELAVARNSGGRSSYRNVGRARRQGAELAASSPLGSGWSLELAATWLDARFRDAFCSGACTGAAAMVAAGARIPGLPQRRGRLRLRHEGARWDAAFEAGGGSAMVADDLGTAVAPGHGLFAFEASRSFLDLFPGRPRGFLRIDNLFDRRHVGSVIVNEANGRYYEPGPGRSVLLGLEWRS